MKLPWVSRCQLVAAEQRITDLAFQLEREVNRNDGLMAALKSLAPPAEGFRDFRHHPTWYGNPSPEPLVDFGTFENHRPGPSTPPIVGLGTLARPEQNDAIPGAQVAAEPCSVPPPGWSCSRGAGHDGPCAASPVEPDDIDVPVRDRRTGELLPPLVPGVELGPPEVKPRGGKGGRINKRAALEAPTDPMHGVDLEAVEAVVEEDRQRRKDPARRQSPDRAARDRAIVAACRKRSVNEVADEYQLTRERVRQIAAKAGVKAPTPTRRGG